MKDITELILKTVGAVAGGLIAITKIFDWSGQDKFSVLAFIASGLVGAILGWSIINLFYKLYFKLTGQKKYGC